MSLINLFKLKKKTLFNLGPIDLIETNGNGIRIQGLFLSKKNYYLDGVRVRLGHLFGVKSRVAA